MVTMPGCTHEICKGCFKDHFTITIKERTVKHFNCPVCGEPDLANRDMSQVVYLELFVGMVSVRILFSLSMVIMQRLITGDKYNYVIMR